MEEKKSIINNLKINDVPQNTSIQKQTIMEGELTGYPSIDKPWLKYYSKASIEANMPEMTIYEYLFKNNIGNFNNVALEYFGKKITFSQLFKNIEETSKSYSAIGVKNGDIVTVCMPSTPEAIYTIYALNKIGATVNLIDPRVSEEMIKDFLNETNSKYLLTIDLCNNKVKSIENYTNLEKIIYVSATNSAPLYVKMFAKKVKTDELNEKWIDWNDFIKDKKEYKTSIYKKNNPSIIVHTGGTTGKPKGVILSDDNVNSIVFQYKNGAIKLSNSQTFLDIIPPFASYGICSSIHMPLSLGMKTILIPKFDPTQFDKLIMKHKPTHVLGVPSFWENLSKNPNMKNKDLSFLLSPGAGGDGISPVTENKINTFFSERNCPSKLIKGYGMSEVSSSACTCVDNCNEISSVGIPLVKNTIGIFNPSTIEELKYNTEGEICITGPSVMLGYYDNEELTNKTLKQHIDGLFWIHTGDLGYMNENGVLYVTGRMKRMIVRYDGFKIYPTSIENIISNCEGVDSVAVVKSQNELGNVVKAYIVAKENVTDLNELKITIEAKCHELLAERAVPSDFEFIEELPKTNLGKIDYDSLENNKLDNQKVLKK